MDKAYLGCVRLHWCEYQGTQESGANIIEHRVDRIGRDKNKANACTRFRLGKTTMQRKTTMQWLSTCFGSLTIWFQTLDGSESFWLED